jgi:hypothetical protein
MVTIATGCSSWERSVKDLDSEFGGLNRTVTIYDQNGEVIKEYKGKIDIQYSEYGNKVLFDLDGKRIIINNAIVIAEEY